MPQARSEGPSVGELAGALLGRSFQRFSSDETRQQYESGIR